MNRQREDAFVFGKNRSGPVAVMHIGVDDHRLANRSIRLHAPNRNSHIVDRAKSFAVICVRVMKPTADVATESIA